MKPVARSLRCAIYTRVSSDQGLEQDFNSLDAQREASEAYIKSQAHEGWICLKDPYDDGGFSGGSMERPALRKLLDDVRARKINIIVVYKVDRLTRSLADFAKLVELFDAHEVSFVSVTQSFNTTSSMGRLTLNVLLSFAQFEREVTGERIRDKIAASKKKGLWMGGIVPYGYQVKDRKLIVDEEEAATVRLIFTRYRELGSIPLLVDELNRQGIRTRLRRLSSGREIGGVPFTTGPLHHMLGNRVYLGEINHHGKSYPGEHAAIVDQELFNAVQHRLQQNRSGRAQFWERSDAFLVKLLFDDRGNRMSPVFARKGQVRYRYYQSWVLAQGRKAEAGSVSRVPAEDIERLVADAVRGWLGRQGHLSDEGDSNASLRSRLEKVVVHSGRIEIVLKPSEGQQASGSQDPPDSDSPEGHVLTIPWSKPPATRRREILGASADSDSSRPIRTEARSRLLAGIARGRRWLQQLAESQAADIDSIARQHDLSAKTVRSTVSLAFLAPDIVQAVINGRLPRGIGISDMTDLPMSWDEQRSGLGIN